MYIMKVCVLCVRSCMFDCRDAVVTVSICSDVGFSVRSFFSNVPECAFLFVCAQLNAVQLVSIYTDVIMCMHIYR